MAFMNEDFIKSFFESIPEHLKDNIYSITHDYFWTHSKIQPSFCDINNGSKFEKYVSKIHFIAQCETTAKNVLVDTKPLSISIIPLPDYYLSLPQE